MSKELETLEKLLSFAFVMSENMVGLTKGNYDEGTFIKKTYEYLHKYSVDLHSRLELEQALQRLESIDNADPSEALVKFKDNTEMFEEIALKDSHSYKDDTVIEAYVYHFNNIVIERALLKAQELEKAPQRLEAVDNAGLNDALEYLEKEIKKLETKFEKDIKLRDKLTIYQHNALESCVSRISKYESNLKQLNAIKLILLKAQGQEGSE